MKKMNVLELIEQIVELTHDQGITTEIKNGDKKRSSAAGFASKALRQGIDEAPWT